MQPQTWWIKGAASNAQSGSLRFGLLPCDTRLGIVLLGKVDQLGECIGLVGNEIDSFVRMGGEFMIKSLQTLGLPDGTRCRRSTLRCKTGVQHGRREDCNCRNPARRCHACMINADLLEHIENQQAINPGN